MNRMATGTKQMITDHLFDMLKRKKLDSITVKSLVEHCGISRQTFYYHFQDIMDVLEWGSRQAMEQALEDSLHAPTAHESIRIFVRLVMRQREVIRGLLQSQHRAEFEELFVKSLHIYLQELFCQKWPNSHLSVADLNALVWFHTFGMIGLILQCCTRESTDEELLVDQIYRLLLGEMMGQLIGP